ncbi:hypothetical protein BDC45DRAFT_515110 [Circinella umbellata]|nr:hypothetical protein BDC45DRAFT_515110 [Circinella umbellata]
MTTTKENVTTAPPNIHNASLSCSSTPHRLSWSPTTMVYDKRRNNSLPLQLNNPANIDYQQQYHGDCTSSTIPSLSPTANEENRSCCNTNHKEKYDDMVKSRSSQEEYSEKQLSKVFRDKIPNIYTRYSRSLLLENKASVARDHLANERTYLAWLRTSLSLITVGVAITQMYHLSPGDTTGMDHRKMGRSIGAIFVTFSILFLYFGNARYFHAQHAMCNGFFPASRGTVLIATTAVLGILLSMFVVILLEHT